MNAPPLFVTFPDATAFLKALNLEDLESEKSDVELLLEKTLPPVASARTLGVLFGYSTRFIMAMAARPRRYYRVFSIQKGHKIRIIKSPRVALKVIQKWFGHHL